MRRRRSTTGRRSKVDLSMVLATPDVPADVARRRTRGPEPVLDDALDWELVRQCAPALERGEPVKLGPIAGPQRQPHRRRHPLGRDRAAATAPTGCRRARSRSRSRARPARASAPGWRRGVTLSLRGETNDYAGKGLSGGIVVGPPARDGAVPRRGEHDRRQHRAVRRHRRPGVLPRPGGRALRRPQLRRARGRRGRRRPRLRVHDRRPRGRARAAPGATSRPA